MTCPAPRDPSDVVKIEVLNQEFSKLQDKLEINRKETLERLLKLFKMASLKLKAISKAREQLNLDEMELKSILGQIRGQLETVEGEEQATYLIAQIELDKDNVELINEFAGSNGSYQNLSENTYKKLMASIAAKKGVSADDLKKVKDVSFAFAAVNAGEFMMGSPSDEEGRYSNEAQRKVKITKPFEIGKTDVTQLQYYLIMGSNPSRFIDGASADYMEVNGVKLSANHPVEKASWNDAQEFIRKLNERDSKYRYRLPTEAEWEYAARAGTTTAYSFGNNKAELSDYAVYGTDETAQVASKKPNPLGLYDMHGNVYQWCSDGYCSAPKGNEDPTGDDSSSDRVMRGGSSLNSAVNVRSADRRAGAPGGPNAYVGFRLVRTPK